MADREYKPIYGTLGRPLLVSLEFEIAQQLLMVDGFCEGRKAVETTEGTLYVPRTPEEVAQRAADIAESLCKTAHEREWVNIIMPPAPPVGENGMIAAGPQFGGRRQ